MCTRNLEMFKCLNSTNCSLSLSSLNSCSSEAIGKRYFGVHRTADRYENFIFLFLSSPTGTRTAKFSEFLRMFVHENSNRELILFTFHSKSDTLTLSRAKMRRIHCSDEEARRSALRRSGPDCRWRPQAATINKQLFDDRVAA